MEDIHLNEIPEQLRDVVVLANRSAGTGAGAAALNEFKEQLENRDLRVFLESDIERFKSIVGELEAEESLRCVVAAGGDGTAELASNLTSPETPLMVFPMGTENLLAKHLQITNDPTSAAEVVSGGSSFLFDAGIIDQKLFLIMFSCGFDADVVHRLHSARSGNINHLSYAKPILESIFSYQYPELHIRCWNGDQLVQELDSHWVFVFNVPSYAAGLGICPSANPHDGLLDVCTFDGGSFWHGIYHLSAVILGQHQNLDGFRNVRATKIEISSNDEVPFQIDGDPGGHIPTTIEVVRHRLNLLVSRDWLKRQAEGNFEGK